MRIIVSLNMDAFSRPITYVDDPAELFHKKTDRPKPAGFLLYNWWRRGESNP